MNVSYFSLFRILAHPFEKDKKKEEVKKDGKTATGNTPTKVEVEPEV